MVLVLLVGCRQNNFEHNIELEKSIYSILEDENKSQIKIESLINFNWDKAFLFRPYTAQESINEQLGVDFKDPSNIASRDDICLLVFLNDGKVVEYAEINRQQYDFFIGENEYLTPSDASIIVKRY